jgi:predicted Zn-dependent protease
MSTPQDIAEAALAHSAADSSIVIVDEYSDANLRWASNTLTTNGETRSRTVTVVAIIGGATGVVARQGVTGDSIEELVRDAEISARTSPPAEDAGPLVGAEASVGDWQAEAADTSISVFAGVAGQIGEAFAQAERASQLLFGYAQHSMVTSYVATSEGLRSRHDQPTGHLEINAKSADYARSVWSGVPTRDFDDLAVAEIYAGLSQRLGWADRRIDLPAGRYDTILPPSAVADLMIPLYWAAVGRDSQEGRTVFSRPGGGTRIGERLTDTPVTLRSDPWSPSIACAPFVTAYGSGASRSVFDNGLPLQPTEWISNGVLTSLIQTRHSAGLSGSATTPYIDNLILDSSPGATGSVEDQVAQMERGLLLTCLWYIREVDPQTLLLTGLTRDGVYLVEGGEIVGAVNNFRFNESPVDMLNRIASTGAPSTTLPREWSDYFGRTIMPPVVVSDFNMSSVSQAS